MWSYREMLRETPQTFWLMVGCVPLGVFLEWAGIQLPALVVEQVTTGQTFAHAATLVGILLGATLLAAALRDFLTAALALSFSSSVIRHCRDSRFMVHGLPSDIPRRCGSESDHSPAPPSAFCAGTRCVPGWSC